MNKPNKPKKSLARKISHLILYLIIMLIVIIGALELIGRLFNPFGISYYIETAEYMDTMIIEEPIGYRNRPKLKGEHYGAPVEINSLGLRDREIPLESEENEYRILIMGDSIPFGVGVKFEDSYPYLLEGILNANSTNKTGRRFRTVNMGVISYNTEQELIQLESLGMKLHPNMVILLFARNDIEPKMWIFEKRSIWYINLSQRSYAASLLYILYGRLRIAISMPPKTIKVENYREDNPSWITIDRSLTKMNSMCRSANVPFIVFTNSLGPTPSIELITEVGLREGFPVIDIFPREDPRCPKNFTTPRGGNHPNAEANNIYATLIYENLVRLGYLPPD